MPGTETVGGMELARSVGGIFGSVVRVAALATHAVTHSPEYWGDPVGQLRAVDAAVRGEEVPAVPVGNLPWELLVGWPRAVGWAACAAGTPPADRVVLRRFLAILADTVFADHTRSVRFLTVAAETPIVGGVRRVADSVFFCRPLHGSATAWVLGIGRGDRLPVGWTAQTTNAVRVWPATEIRAFLQLAELRGEVPAGSAVAHSLATLTGMTSEEAVVAWVGMPAVTARPTESDAVEVAFAIAGGEEVHVAAGPTRRAGLRDRLGISETAGDRVDRTTAALGVFERLTITDLAFGRSPEELWDPLQGKPSPVARFAAVWAAVVGTRTPFDGAVVDTLDQLVFGPTYHQTSAASLLERMTAGPVLRGDRMSELVLRGGLWPAVSGGPTVEDIVSLARAVSALTLLLPGEATALRRLPEHVAALVACLGEPGLMLDVGVTTALTEPLSEFGPIQQFADGRGERVDVGARVLARSGFGGAGAIFLRPAAVGKGGVGDPKSDDLARVVRAVRQTSYMALAAESAAADLPSGRYLADPTMSAPDIVDEASAATGLSPDTTVLWLQVLALPSVTDTWVCRWNGWEADRVVAAADALDAVGLIRFSRRRDVGTFMAPGPVLQLPESGQRIARSSFELYGGILAADGRPSLPLGRLLPVRPLAELFRTAWQRVRED
ncbi:MAG: hypothetical protein IT198_12655 [Acidimicrobiia bacterium]|nr:hypothetical protein [Acidimicrobiia bacterium]